MLLPDQTYEQCQDILAPLEALRKILEESKYEPRLDDGNNYKQDVASVEKKKTEKLNRAVDNSDNELRSCSPESYGKTSEFFNNIPLYTGEPLGPFSIPNKRTSIRTSADVLKECESFLYKHRIRPDFFCRYRKAIKYESTKALLTYYVTIFQCCQQIKISNKEPSIKDVSFLQCCHQI